MSWQCCSIIYYSTKYNSIAHWNEMIGKGPVIYISSVFMLFYSTKKQNKADIKKWVWGTYIMWNLIIYLVLSWGHSLCYPELNVLIKTLHFWEETSHSRLHIIMYIRINNQWFLSLTNENTKIVVINDLNFIAFCADKSIKWSRETIIHRT